MGIPDHLTCLLRNLYVGILCLVTQSCLTLCTPWTIRQQLELDMEQLTGSKLGKEYDKAVYCCPVYLTYAEYIMLNASLDESITSWNQDCQEKYQQTSDMQIILL